MIRNHAIPRIISCPMRGGLLALALAMLMPIGLRADDVWAGSPGRKPLKYGSVRIRGDQAGELVYLGRAGNIVTKPIEEVTRINVQDEPELNRAEELFSQQQYAPAIEPYEKVRDKTALPWLGRYVTARLIKCYDEAGRLPEAVDAWARTLERWPSYAVTRAPSKFGKKGSDLNKRALDVLAKAMTGSLPPESKEAVKALQVAIWGVEGDPRAQTAAPARPARPGEGDQRGEDDGAASAGAVAGKVDVVEALSRADRHHEAKRYDDALIEINRALAGMPERRRQTYMPRLLALKAACLMAKGDALAKAGKADQARAEYIRAGLAAMHVVAFFQDSPSFIECLYLTGSCHEKIGAGKQAIALYRECKEYAIGRAQPQWERQAVEALKRLDVKTE
ncbi:MAG: hypothetical protein JXQ73_20015 [Phycisphaerae bacterium]|nr:hypothetical protein [Phycisphaerae bacterium]